MFVIWFWSISLEFSLEAVCDRGGRRGDRHLFRERAQREGDLPQVADFVGGDFDIGLRVGLETGGGP